MVFCFVLFLKKCFNLVDRLVTFLKGKIFNSKHFHGFFNSKFPTCSISFILKVRLRKKSWIMSKPIRGSARTKEPFCSKWDLTKITGAGVKTDIYRPKRVSQTLPACLVQEPGNKSANTPRPKQSF